MKLPLIRIGLTLAIGSIIASAVRFYVAIGAAAADLNSDLPTNPRGIQDWFFKDFLFKGSIPEILFWTGVAVCIVGMVRLANAPRRART